MNEIQAALAQKDAWELKRSLYEKYGDQPGLKTTFSIRLHEKPIRDMLTYHLKLLRFKSHIEPVQTQATRPTPGQLPLTDIVNVSLTGKSKAPHYESEAEYPKQSDQNYPAIIKKAIQDRRNAFNWREQAGRKLTEGAETLPEATRQELIANQKHFHKVFMQSDAVIKTWQSTGQLPIPEHKPEPEKPQLSEAARKQLEREWTNNQRRRLRAKRAVEKYRKEKNDAKVDYNQAIFDRSQKRLMELSPILGRKLKKYHGT